MTKSKIKAEEKIFLYIIEMGSLMFMPRTHTRSLINTFDDVSSHCHHTGIIAYCLARMEGLSHADGLKALTMGVLHDTPEARTGDLDYLSKHYATTDEKKAVEHQLNNLPFGDDLLKVVEEYEERNTAVAKCAKDADAFEQLYQEWVLTHLGNKMAERWFLGDYKNRVPSFRTKSAKKLALIMKNAEPHDWWFKDLVEDNFNENFLNGKK
jgi:putative hydrolases of HD superfamily